MKKTQNSITVKNEKKSSDGNKQSEDAKKEKPNNAALKAGKHAPKLLATGVILMNKYRIQGMIGGGGYGQIYRAYDMKNKTFAAVKAEPADYQPRRLVLEQTVLFTLNGSKHFPKLMASGTFGNVNYLVMEMLGKNLSELRKRQKFRRFTITTVVTCGCQAVDALKHLHDIGYIHRDMKPSNMCIGLTAESRKFIHLVDFGMVRRFRYENGKLRKKRKYAAFRGTIRYASINVHLRNEQNPADDCISLYYSLVELGEGALPWKARSNDRETAKCKINSDFSKYCCNLPLKFHYFMKYLYSVSKKNEAIDYRELKATLKDCLPKEFNEEKYIHDWDQKISSTDATVTTVTAK